MGNSTAAAAYHRRALAEGLKTGASKAELSKVYLWLARWELQREKEKGAEGDFEKAEEYLKEVMQVQEDKEVSFRVFRARVKLMRSGVQEAKVLHKEMEVLLMDRDTRA